MGDVEHGRDLVPLPVRLSAIGVAASAVQIGQLALLARTGDPQDVVVGGFNTASSALMAHLPVVASIVVRYAGYGATFGLVMLTSLSVALTIHRCSYGSTPAGDGKPAPRSAAVLRPLRASSGCGTSEERSVRMIPPCRKREPRESGHALAGVRERSTARL